MRMLLQCCLADSRQALHLSSWLARSALAILLLLRACRQRPFRPITCRPPAPSSPPAAGEQERRNLSPLLRVHAMLAAPVMPAAPPSIWQLEHERAATGSTAQQPEWLTLACSAAASRSRRCWGVRPSSCVGRGGGEGMAPPAPAAAAWQCSSQLPVASLAGPLSHSPRADLVTRACPPRQGSGPTHLLASVSLVFPRLGTLAIDFALVAAAHDALRRAPASTRMRAWWFLQENSAPAPHTPTTRARQGPATAGQRLRIPTRPPTHLRTHEGRVALQLLVEEEGTCVRNQRAAALELVCATPAPRADSARAQRGEKLPQPPPPLLIAASAAQHSGIHRNVTPGSAAVLGQFCRPVDHLGAPTHRRRLPGCVRHTLRTRSMSC
jgi:hypothetical protein